MKIQDDKDDYEKIDEIKTHTKVEKKQEGQNSEKRIETTVPQSKSLKDSENLWKRDDVT